ncbi:MAG TPA: DJ-1/PfpI family protein [Nitrospirota bacterium]|nr:DJ-1/PfpI family protein [Nitrospirota bacterium]
MRKYIRFISIIFFMGVVSLLAYPLTTGSTESFGQNSHKVLMVLREGYSTDLDLAIKMEVGVMTKILKDAGFEVDIATTSGQTILGPNQKIENVLRLSEINLDNYVGVIMPCMGVGMFPGPPVSPEAVAVVKKTLASGKPVAAAANATIVLADAGVLKGKKYAYYEDPLQTSKTRTRTDTRFKDAIYSGPGVVQDGKIITSGVCPVLESRYGMQSGTVELTKKFITTISL